MERNRLGSKVSDESILPKLIVYGRYVLPVVLTIGVVVYIIANVQSDTANWQSAGVALAAAVFVGFLAPSSLVDAWLSNKEEKKKATGTRKTLIARFFRFVPGPTYVEKFVVLGLIVIVILSSVISLVNVE